MRLFVGERFSPKFFVRTEYEKRTQRNKLSNRIKQNFHFNAHRTADKSVARHNANFMKRPLIVFILQCRFPLTSDVLLPKFLDRKLAIKRTSRRMEDMNRNQKAFSCLWNAIWFSGGHIDDVRVTSNKANRIIWSERASAYSYRSSADG